MPPSTHPRAHTHPFPNPRQHDHQYVAADMSITAHYGLFKIEFFGTSNFVSDYLDWSAAQPETSSAYTYIQGVRACAVLGLAALAVQFLGSLRLWCAKDMRVRRRFTVLCTMMAALDFVFTGLALLLWKASGSPSSHFHAVNSECECLCIQPLVVRCIPNIHATRHSHSPSPFPLIKPNSTNTHTTDHPPRGLPHLLLH